MVNTIEIDYKRVDSVVRPHRYAVLVDTASKTWPNAAKRAIEAFSTAWGGEYFVLIPTDGKTIAQAFWNILDAYSPDEIGIYRETLADLKRSDPDAYNNVIDQWRTQIGLDDKRFSEFVANNEAAQNISNFDISQLLKQELKERLRPNRADNLVVRHAVFAGRELDWPFSNISDIFSNSKDIPGRIFRPKQLENTTLDLLAASFTGGLTEQHEAKLAAHGMNIQDLPADFTDRDYMSELLSRDRSGMLSISRPGSLDSEWREQTPFALSMLNLTRVYRLEPHKSGREGTLVVVGDSISDFCLFYSLRRIQENVYWLPDSLLGKLLNKYRRNNLRRVAAGTEEYDRITLTQDEEMTETIILSLLSAVSYNMRDDRTTELTSISLSKSQLQNRARRAATTPSLATDLFSKVSIIEAATIDVSYIARVMELYNYTTQQTLTLKNNRSVEQLVTPKPKHFTRLDGNHRWITSITIDGYSAPKLSFAGNAIVGDGRSGAYDARVATDGIAYLTSARHKPAV
jgi:hypothetical protein